MRFTYKYVPDVPTEAMLRAGCAAWGGQGGALEVQKMWLAMWRAATQIQPDEVVEAEP